MGISKIFLRGMFTEIQTYLKTQETSQIKTKFTHKSEKRRKNKAQN